MEEGCEVTPVPVDDMDEPITSEDHDGRVWAWFKDMEDDEERSIFMMMQEGDDAATFLEAGWQSIQITHPFSHS